MMNKISVITVRVILFLVVALALYLYYPFVYRCFVALVNTDFLNHAGNIYQPGGVGIAGTNSPLNSDFFEIVLNLVAIVAGFIVVPGIFLFYMWKVSERIGDGFFRPRRASRKGRRRKSPMVVAGNEKSKLGNNNQLKQDKLALEAKVAALKQELMTELRDEMQRLLDKNREAEGGIEKARALYKAGNYKMAQEECNKAIAIAPFAVAYYVRGVIHHKMGLDEQAMSDLIEAAKLGYHKAQDFLGSKNIAY